MLCECINSILVLSLRDFEREIIVIDDGSDISPMNGLMQYGDDIIYIRQKRQGDSIARNTGLNMAKGQFVQIINSEDFLIQAPYERCLDIIRYKSDTDAVFFNYTQNGKSHASTATPNRYSGTDYMRNRNLQGGVCCYLFRNAVRGQLEFSPSISYGEENEFISLLLLRTEVIYEVEDKAYYYRQRPTSSFQESDTDSKQKQLDDALHVIKSLNFKADRLPNNDRLAMQRRVAQLTMDYILNIMTLTPSRQELEKRIQELYAAGLFPLPDKDYSKKYLLFRKMSSTAIGRSILMHTLPIFHKLS